MAAAFLDHRGRILGCSPAFERLFGYTRDEILGKPIDALITDSDLLPEASRNTQRALEEGDLVLTAGRRRRKDGTSLDAEILGVPVEAPGCRRGVLVIYREVHKILNEFPTSLRTLLDSLDADIYVADMKTYEILFMNQHMSESFGGDFVGRICYEVFRQETQPCKHCTNPKLINKNGKPRDVYVWEGRNPVTGRWYKNSDRVIPWHDGRYVRLQIASDITDLKDTEARLEHMATHDALTGLPNRLLFQDRLSHALRMAHRVKSLFAVLFLDLDGFKMVNDRYGHLCGDELLKAVAGRMLTALRDCDTLARVSGDEFAVILEELPEPQVCSHVASRILSTLSRSYLLGGCEITITASAGIALYPQDGETAEQLLRAADEAMYFVKNHGKNDFARKPYASG